VKYLALVCAMLVGPAALGVGNEPSAPSAGDASHPKQSQSIIVEAEPNDKHGEADGAVISTAPTAAKSESVTQREQVAATGQKVTEETAARERQLIEYTGKTADYTGAIALLALAALIVSIAQAWFFWRQLNHMREGMRDAATVARATQVSADIADKTFQRIQRPYIFISGIGAITHDGFDDKSFVEYSVVNHGQIPAVIEDVQTSFACLPQDFPDPTLQAELDHELFVHDVVGAGKRRPRIKVFAPEGMRWVYEARQRMAPMVEPNEYLFVRVVIKYRGPFTSGHETSACWKYDGYTNSFIAYRHDQYTYTG
jgi:hypothetical protein